MPTETKTLSDYKHLIGKTCWINLIVCRVIGHKDNRAWFPVLVHQLEWHKGIMAKITPANGIGRAWVMVDRLRETKPEQ